MDTKILLYKLSKSTFRTGFKLQEKDKDYITKKGMDTIRSHAYDFINERIKPEIIPNDGKQTPTKGHPIFIAQHACACCCRTCLNKWHKIPINKELSEDEVEYIVEFLMEWVIREYHK